MQTITFEELNKNTCLRFTHDSDQVMVTFLQADICLIAAADKQKFITDMQVVIERYAQLPTFNGF
ncbi:MAG TPA: hypothetical protein PLR63_08795 [Paludibacteraceae bacterium]|jgi:hypothetical protein|nr:hypothetical protein [Paludibacteraceae bacterium]